MTGAGLYDAGELKRAVLTITVGAFAFLAAFVVTGVGFWSFLFAVSGGPAFTAHPDWIGDALLGIYMMTIPCVVRGVRRAGMGAPRRVSRRARSP